MEKHGAAKAVVVIVGVAFLIALIVGELGDDSAPPRPLPPLTMVPTLVNAEPPAPPPSEPPPLAVTAEQLHRDYEVNEVSADERYLGRTLVVTGIVRAVRKALDVPYVDLATSNMFLGVHARFASASAAAMSRFRRGDKIVLRCVGEDAVVGMPQLGGCTLEHHYRRDNRGLQ